MKKNWIVWCLTLCLMVTTAGQGLAFNGIATNWKNTYPDVCATLTAAANDCTLCHSTGFGLNSYGVDLNNAGLNFASIEGDDSDGDGRSNLQEITLDCTLPGDASSVPVDPNTWESIKALYH